jgi:hypothetical protein
LLPSFEGAVDPQSGFSGDLFLLTTWQRYQPGILDTLASFIRIYGLDLLNPEEQKEHAERLLTKLLDAARQHRDRIETLTLDDPKRWLCIVGVNATTRVRMQIQKDTEGNPRFDLSDKGVLNKWSDKKDPALHILTGDETVPYLGARPKEKLIPTNQVVCVIPGDYGFWEVKDKLLNKAGFHANLPNMNLVQRLVVSHFKDEKYGDVWGRTAPDLPADKKWDPPIQGLTKK